MLTTSRFALFLSFSGPGTSWCEMRNIDEMRRSIGKLDRMLIISATWFV